MSHSPFVSDLLRFRRSFSASRPSFKQTPALFAPAPAIRPDDGRARGNRRRVTSGASGVNGVYRTPSGKFVARLRVAGKAVGLGTFATLDLAAAAVRAKELELVNEKGMISGEGNQT